MSRKKLKIAVTGGIGGGKSLFCKFISDKGYPVFSADDLAKKIMLSNKEIKTKIIKNFGREAYVKSKLNNRFLADKVFSSPANVKKINSIVHPAVITELNKLMKEALKKSSSVFVEAALIFEAKMESIFDYVVLITSEDDIRKKRLKSKGISVKEFNKRNLNQIPDEKKRKKSDFVFENNGDKEDLKLRAEIFLKLIGD